MTIEIGQMYKDPYPVNGRIRRFVVSGVIFAGNENDDLIEVAVLEPRKRTPSKFVCLRAKRFNGPHARGLVRVK